MPESYMGNLLGRGGGNNLLIIMTCFIHLGTQKTITYYTYTFNSGHDGINPFIYRYTIPTYIGTYVAICKCIYIILVKRCLSTVK